MNKIKVAVISDTHNRAEKLIMPSADILIHCGDYSSRGCEYELEDFKYWIDSVSHLYKHIILVPGNHDRIFQAEEQQSRLILNNVTVLIDEYVEILGLRIYGTPYQPFFNNWAFNLKGKALHDKYRKIPDKLDILITHSPPKGILDSVRQVFDRKTKTYLEHVSYGSEFLYKQVVKKQPRFHFFGHIHDSFGVFNSGTTVFANASSCSEKYEITNQVLVFEI